MAEKMGNLKRTNYCNEISEEMISKEVTLMGWVAKQRSLGSIIFVDLRDRSRETEGKENQDRKI